MVRSSASYVTIWVQDPGIPSGGLGNADSVMLVSVLQAHDCSEIFTTRCTSLIIPLLHDLYTHLRVHRNARLTSGVSKKINK